MSISSGTSLAAATLGQQLLRPAVPPPVPFGPLARVLLENWLNNAGTLSQRCRAFIIWLIQGRVPEFRLWLSEQDDLFFARIEEALRVECPPMSSSSQVFLWAPVSLRETPPPSLTLAARRSAVRPREHAWRGRHNADGVLLSPQAGCRYQSYRTRGRYPPTVNWHPRQ